MLHSIGVLLVSLGLIGALVQFAVMLVSNLVTIYGILRMRHDDVVVLSHGQLMVSTLVSTAICTGIYQGFLWIGPAERWSRGWVIGLMMVLLLVTRAVTMKVVGSMDGGRSVRDTTSSEAGMFNCNWPLISRCANQGLLLLMFIFMYMKNLMGAK